MPPFRDPYNHEQKLADLTAHYERARKRAARTTRSAYRKMALLGVCALALAGWTGALLDWSRALDQRQSRLDFAPVARAIDETARDIEVRAQLDACEQEIRERNGAWMHAAQAVYIDLHQADEALTDCEEERDGLERELYRPDGSSVLDEARAAVHEDRR